MTVRSLLAVGPIPASMARGARELRLLVRDLQSGVIWASGTYEAPVTLVDETLDDILEEAEIPFELAA